tara:strand:+ start:603 stop:2489 length:1887 start_codon:yes stop_codon:yes gene_type:complete
VKLKYRPEIDSLRAISVLGVIIYHSKIYFFGKLFFQGGYFGVDIFFVISGYLITSIIYEDLGKNQFSLKKFYIKRCRRIFPALIFTILISLFLSWYSVMPVSFIEYAKSIIYSLIFVSNYYFYFSGLEYGAVSGLLKPLLHTWSLAIEEQFYIIFPLIFIFGYRKFRKNLILYLGILLFVSFITAIYYSNFDPKFNFYFIGGRAWELLIGSLLFLLSYKSNLQIKTTYSNLSTFFGLLLIFISFQFNYDTNPTPNLNTVLPLLGASIIIFTYKKEGFLNLLFVNKFVLKIGLISYSLYLLHYPIFAFVRANRLAHSNIDYFVVALIIFFLSYISYRYIEKPFRNFDFIKNKSLMKILIGSIIFLCSSSLFIIGNKGFENRYPSLSNFSLDYEKYRKELRDLKYKLGTPSFKVDTKKNLLIIGNSHGRDLFNTLKLNESIFLDYEFSMLDTKVSCLKFINENKLCDKTLSKLQKNIFNQAEIIIISSRYDDKDLIELDNVVQKLLPYNKKIILASNRPQFNFSSNNLTIIDEFFLNNKRLPYENEKLDLKKKYFLSINPNLQKKNTVIEKIAEDNQIEFINMEKLICADQKKTCEFLTSNNSKIIFDDSHFTVEGAKYLGAKIKELNWF